MVKYVSIKLYFIGRHIMKNRSLSQKSREHQTKRGDVCSTLNVVNKNSVEQNVALEDDANLGHLTKDETELLTKYGKWAVISMREYQLSLDVQLEAYRVQYDEIILTELEQAMFMGNISWTNNL